MKDFDANFFWNVYKCCVTSLSRSYFSLKVIAALGKIVLTFIDKIPTLIGTIKNNEYIPSFEVNFFFRRWSFFASACFLNLFFSCGRFPLLVILSIFFCELSAFRYASLFFCGNFNNVLRLRVYFRFLVFPFWCQPYKFPEKVLLRYSFCCHSNSFWTSNFLQNVWSNIDIKSKLLLSAS